MDLSFLADNVSTMTLFLDHIDVAGNPALQVQQQLTRDVLPPVVGITSSQVINEQNADSYILEGTCSETGRKVGVQVGSATRTEVDCVAGTWSFSGATFVEGHNTVDIDQEDALGNTGLDSGAISPRIRSSQLSSSPVA